MMRQLLLSLALAAMVGCPTAKGGLTSATKGRPSAPLRDAWPHRDHLRHPFPGGSGTDSGWKFLILGEFVNPRGGRGGSVPPGQGLVLLDIAEEDLQQDSDYRGPSKRLGRSCLPRTDRP